MSAKGHFWFFYEKDKWIFTHLRKTRLETTGVTGAAESKERASSSTSAEERSGVWFPHSTCEAQLYTQPACSLQLLPAQPQHCSSSRGWLQPRLRWSSQPCRSQSLWASLTPPWITILSWRRWWCWLQGHPSSLPPHPKVLALAPESQEISMTTLLEVRQRFYFPYLFF